MKILVLSRYGELGASSRVRFLQYFSLLRECDIELVFSPLFGDSVLRYKYENGSYGFLRTAIAYVKRFSMLLKANDFDCLWIEKELFPWLPYWVERFFLSKSSYVLDFDDAIFHNYDLSDSKFIVALFGNKIDRLMKRSTLVFAGNDYLSRRAVCAGTNQIVKVPTVVDLNRYGCIKNCNHGEEVSIVWIGSPTTVKYLKVVSDALKKLSLIYSIKLRIIGADFKLDGVNVEVLPWQFDSEVRLIQESDIGIMPLEYTPWEQGKCAYKLIQYMACGLPTVSSPVGANLEVVIDGETGFFANSTDEWFAKLASMIESKTMREKFGANGRHRIESNYSLQVIGPQIVRSFLAINES